MPRQCWAIGVVLKSSSRTLMSMSMTWNLSTTEAMCIFLALHFVKSGAPLFLFFLDFWKMLLTIAVLRDDVTARLDSMKTELTVNMWQMLLQCTWRPVYGAASQTTCLSALQKHVCCLASSRRCTCLLMHWWSSSIRRRPASLPDCRRWWHHGPSRTRSWQWYTTELTWCMMWPLSATEWTSGAWHTSYTWRWQV